MTGGGMKRHATKTLHFNFTDGSAISAQAGNCSHIANRFIYSHKRYTDFDKVIITVKDVAKDEHVSFANVQHYFDKDEHKIDFAGNKSKQTSFSIWSSIKALNQEG